MPRRQPSSGEPKKIPHLGAPNPRGPTSPPAPCRGRLGHPSQRLSHSRNFRAVGASSAGAPLRGSGLPGCRAQRGGCPGPGGCSTQALEIEAWEISPPTPPPLSLHHRLRQPRCQARGWGGGPLARPSHRSAAGPGPPPTHHPPAFIILLLLLLALSCAAEGLQLPWIRRRFRSSARLSRNSHLCAEETGHPEPLARLAPAPPPGPGTAGTLRTLRPGTQAAFVSGKGKKTKKNHKPTQQINKWGGKNSPCPPLPSPPALPRALPLRAGEFGTEWWRHRSKVALTRRGKVHAWGGRPA